MTLPLVQIETMVPCSSIQRSDGEGRVALICMPWSSTSTPSLAMALLKAVLHGVDVECRLHYFNLTLGRLIGIKWYRALSHFGFIYPEWFFSVPLFGKLGSGELENDWDDVRHTELGRSLIRTLVQHVGCSEAEAEEKCRLIGESISQSFINDCLASDDWSRYTAVGFTTTFAQTTPSLLLAKRIKLLHPSVTIVFGGANVDGEMGLELLRGAPFVDCVVHGEAEESLPALLNTLRSGKVTPVLGVSYQRGEGREPFSGIETTRPLADLDRSPVPDYSDYIAALKTNRLYSRSNLDLFYESSRGCWWGAKKHCTFCGLNGSTMSYRRKSPERVLSELVELSTKYECVSLAATDNILSLDYFPSLLTWLANGEHDFELFYEVKANLKRSQVELLAQAGVTKIQPGIESLSSRLLQLMNKGITAIQNIQLLKWCAQFGIRPSWNILHGFPGETVKDYSTLADTLLLLWHLTPPSGLTPIQFERFSPYFARANEYGLQLKPDAAYASIYPDQRFCLDKLSYFFSNAAAPAVGECDDALSKAQIVLDGWKHHNKQWNGVCSCTYQRGAGFIVISDRRSCSTPDSDFAEITLRGVLAKVYMLCDEIRTIKQIQESLALFPANGAELTITAGLDKLVRHGLVFREGDRYLALAIRAPRDNS